MLNDSWYIAWVYMAGFELDKQNQFAKKDPKNFFDLRNILWKMQRVLTKYYKLIWTDMYYKSLWNHVVIQQGIFNRLKITYYIASSMNNSENSWSI